MKEKNEEGKLVGGGFFRIDADVMSRKIDEELEKIVGEEMRPFLGHKNDAKWLFRFVAFPATASSCTSIFFFTASSAFLYKILPYAIFSSFLFSGISVFLFLNFINAKDIEELVKIFFTSITQSIKLSVLAGRIDIKNIQSEFENRLFLRRDEIEWMRDLLRIKFRNY